MFRLAPSFPIGVPLGPVKPTLDGNMPLTKSIPSDIDKSTEPSFTITLPFPTCVTISDEAAGDCVSSWRSWK
jgi:hypothetical protein